MAYQALARKWRPKKFADLVGQEHVVDALQNALQQGRLHHAYLLTGTRGVGKTTIARILAKSLNCEQGVGGEPCGVCPACIQIDSGRFVDLLEIDAASNTGIDNIREVLENAQYMPTSGRYKVYIIDEVHMLSKSAFNAMLKTLEEPPEHVKFILATTDPHKVPVTVLSRCLQFVLRNMTTQQISSHLAYILNEEKIPHEEAALTVLARAGAGSMRDALSLLDQAIALGSNKVTEDNVRHMLGAVDKRYLFGLLSSILAQDGKALMQQAEELSIQAVGFGNTLTEMASLLQQLALVQTVPDAVLSDNEAKDSLVSFAKMLSPEQIQLYYQCVLQGKKDLALAPDEYAGFVMTLLRMLAFAPLAAGPRQIDWQVEGSQLKTPNSSSPIEKSQSTVSISQNQLNKFDSSISETAESIGIKQEILSDVIEKEADNISSAREEPQEKKETFLVDSSVETKKIDVDLPWDETKDNNIIALSDEENHQTSQVIDAFVELPASQIVSQTEEIEQPEKRQHVDVSDEPNNFESLPELTIANWSDIVDILKPKLGAAQMLLKNAVLAKIEGQVISLALSDQAVNSAEILTKVEQILSSAYNTKWIIHTQSLVLGQETPNMKLQKEKEQNRAKAQAYLDSDPVAQELLGALTGEWLFDTVELKS